MSTDEMLAAIAPVLVELAERQRAARVARLAVITAGTHARNLEESLRSIQRQEGMNSDFERRRLGERDA